MMPEAGTEKSDGGVFLSSINRLLRATAFKLSFVYLVIFTTCAMLMLVYVDSSVRKVLYQSYVSSVEAELFDLGGQNDTAGQRALITVIQQRMRARGASLYLLTSPDKHLIVGNVPAMPATNVINEGAPFEYTFNDEQGKLIQAVVQIQRLQDGSYLMVGRDLAQLAELRGMIRNASDWSIVLAGVLGCLGGWFIARRVLSRVDEMTADTMDIISGNLSSRLQVAGTGDELDRLAESINEMLDRIEELMMGLKQVSDNIAHDLKTPLTRLRNRADEALRSAVTVEDLQGALGDVIEESDNLIKIFNALLMIARLEAGHASENLSYFDAASVTADVAELYEAVAEDEGVRLSLRVAHPLRIYGSRELLGQAIANLIDNALKYGPPAEDGKPAPLVVVEVKSEADYGIISVSDQGKGIPDAADKARVLVRFTRLESSRSLPGFGLGLSLVSAVASLHGGYVKLEDNHPGLLVKLILPLKERHMPLLGESKEA